MKRGWCLILVALAAGWPAAARAQAPLDAPKAFEALRVLVGDWEAKLESGKVIRVSYRRMSGDSILVETFRTPSGKETLSVYHLDRARLLLTHYCGMGNQPRLRLDLGRSAPEKLVFEFQDATNLASKKKPHMVRLEVALLDGDRFDQTSTYRAGKEEETDTLHFVRVGKASKGGDGPAS